MSSSGVKNLEALRPALAFLRQAFRYDYLHQDDPAFQRERASLNEAILQERLLRKLRELNAGCAEEELRQAANHLVSPAHASLAHVQRELHGKMLAASWSPAGAPSSKTRFRVQYFDFENPAQNDFLMVEQFQLARPGGVEALDAVIFVNGIPLAAFEARAAHEHEGLRRGIERLQALQSASGIPRFFHTVQVLAVLQRNAACYGSVAAPAESFQGWDDCAPMSWEELRALLRQTPYRENDLPTPQDILLAGMFAPGNFLALVRSFTAFVSLASGRVQKRLARCHQFQAVQSARARLFKAAPENLPAASGVIEHPAGAGKPYSLFWLAGKLREETPHTLLILTECPALIELFKTAWPQRGWSNLIHLSKKATLAQAVEREPGSTIIASPRQFRAAASAKNAGCFSVPAIVLIDEPQRSDYPELVDDLEQALPAAAILSFTSFPVPLAGSSAARGMQALIHRYPRPQAEREGSIVPIRWESRLPEWHVGDFPAAQPPVLAMPAAAKNEARVHAIADDIFLHFNRDVAANGNAALLAAADADLAARYCELLEERMPGKVAAALPASRRERKRRSEPPQKQVSQQNPLATVLQRLTARAEPVLIVTAENLPAPVVAPSLQALYLDRPLRGLAWWEAIALIQRPASENKAYGLVVDYWGNPRTMPVSEEAQEAEVIESRYAESQFEELHHWRRELSALFDYSAARHRLEHGLAALAAAEKRAVFARAWRRFARTLDQLLPQVLHEPLWQEACRWHQLRKEAALFYFDEVLATAPASRKLDRLFEEEARWREPFRIREGVSLYGQDFWQELDAFETLAVKILRLLYVLYHEIRRAMPADPVYYQTLEQRVQKIEIEHQLGRLDEAATFAKLREEAMRLRVDKGERSLATHALAFLGILQRFLANEEDPPVQRAQLEKLAYDMLAALAPETTVVDWTRKDDVQREMRRKIKRLLRAARCPQDLQEALTAELMKIARARLA